MTILDRRLLIVGGKGGTGKSSVAAALGQLSAFRGNKTLIVSADGSPGAAGLFDMTPGYEAVEVGRNLSVLQINSDESLQEFVGLQLGPLAVMGKPVASAFSFVAQAAPGVLELLLVGKYLHEARSGSWDLVVVDAASSGHLLGELAAPRNVGEIAPVGRLARETDWMIELLSDPDITGVVNVTLAEEVPVSETIEFADRLTAETPANLAAVVVNRTRPQLYAKSGRDELDAFLAKPPARMTQGVAGVLAAIEVGLARADVASAIDAQLRDALPDGMPLLHVPEFGIVDSVHAEVREAIADELSL